MSIVPYNDTYCSPEEEEKSYKVAERMFDSLYFFLPISAFGALFANICYLIVVTVGIRKGKLPLKRYALTINRTCADILVLLLGAFFYIRQKMETCPTHICMPTEIDFPKRVVQTVFILNYWCVSLSYTGIAVLTNYAVRAPLQYKINLTSLKVAKYIVLGWLALFLLLIFCVVLVHNGELDYNSNSVIHLFLDDFDSSDEHLSDWLVDLCYQIRVHPATRSLIVTIVPPLVFYIISLISYIFIIQLLFSRRKITSYHRHWGSMLRLGIHLLLFAGTCVLTGTAYLGSYSILPLCDGVVDPNEPMCLDHILEYLRNTAAALLGWILRMIIDATVDTVNDDVLRRTFAKSVRLHPFAVLLLRPAHTNTTNLDVGHHHSVFEFRAKLRVERRSAKFECFQTTKLNLLEVSSHKASTISGLRRPESVQMEALIKKPSSKSKKSRVVVESPNHHHHHLEEIV